MPGVRLDRDPEGEARKARERAAAPWVMGFCIFGGDVESVSTLTRELREIAGRDLWIASDMERGAGQQIQGLAHMPPYGLLGFGASPHEVKTIANATAIDALSVGVDVLFAPMLDVRSAIDNPIVGNRSFGWDAARVAMMGVAHVEGVLAAGARPVGKHFPGHGATTEDSHDACPRVPCTRAELEMRDLVPFRHALRAGCPALMTAHERVPALDATDAVATFSRAILDLGRAMAPAPDDLVLFTDALLMAGALEDGLSETEAARRALLAGCDVLLYPDDPEQVAATFFDVDASEADSLRSRSEEAAARIARSTKPDPVSLIEPGEGGDIAEAARVDASNAVLRTLLWAGVVAEPPRTVWVYDDDGTESYGDAFRAALGDRCVVATPDDDRAPPSSLGPDDAIVVFARVRAWKDAAGVSEAGMARLKAWGALDDAGPRVVWCTPLPGPRGVHVPGTGPLVEDGLALLWEPA